MVCCRRRGDRVQIEVRDSGIGIAQDKHGDIFLEFFQIGHAAAGDSVMGLGLGLAIVSRLARLLGTEVRVRSAPDKGSVFSLRLLRGEPGLILPPDEVSQATFFGKSELDLHVLVVDDDPLVLAGNRALLEELGFGLDLASCAATGKTADLIYVSPKSGRAVSAGAGEPYKGRLLALPALVLPRSRPNFGSFELPVT